MQIVTLSPKNYNNILNKIDFENQQTNEQN